MTTEDFTRELDRIGALLDEIIFPILVGWAIYLGKGFLIRLANKLGLPPPPDKPP